LFISYFPLFLLPSPNPWGKIQGLARLVLPLAQLLIGFGYCSRYAGYCVTGLTRIAKPLPKNTNGTYVLADGRVIMGNAGAVKINCYNHKQYFALYSFAALQNLHCLLIFLPLFPFLFSSHQALGEKH